MNDSFSSLSSGRDLDNDIKYCTVNLSVSHVVATGGDAHLGEPVQDLLDLLVSGGGVYLDVRVVHQHVVQVGNLQAQPFLAEQNREAVLQCLEIFRPEQRADKIVITF